MSDAGRPQEDVPLDVRTLPHAQRHQTIFNVLPRLAAGQTRVITVDHDRAGEAGPPGTSAGDPAAAVELDVRSFAPARRHELIFETFQALKPNRAFVLVNDHDPKPLYYPFAAELEGQFTWAALESGAEVWRVRIGRTPS